MMGITREVRVGGVLVTVRELTPLEVRNWLGALDLDRFDLVGDGLVMDFPKSLLVLMSDADPEFIESVPLSEGWLRIKEAAEQCNPDFFGLLRRLGARASLEDPSRRTSPD